MDNDLRNAAYKAVKFLDGLCIGHTMADRERHEILKTLLAALDKDKVLIAA